MSTRSGRSIVQLLRNVVAVFLLEPFSWHVGLFPIPKPRLLGVERIR